MNKKIILISTFAILGILVLGQAVYAANSILSVSPATASKNVGTAFNIAVRIDPQGNKICVVKGTLSFDNLTCRNITVESGLIAQTMPTCSSPKFVLGIPKCTTQAQNVLTVSVKGNNIGQAKASLTGANVIGVGTAVVFVANGGIYNITAVASQTLPQNVGQPIETQQVQNPVQQTAPANVGTASVVTAGSRWVNIFWMILLILTIIACVVYVIYRLKGKKK